MSHTEQQAISLVGAQAFGLLYDFLARRAEVGFAIEMSLWCFEPSDKTFDFPICYTLDYYAAPSPHTFPPPPPPHCYSSLLFWLFAHIVPGTRSMAPPTPQAIDEGRLEEDGAAVGLCTLNQVDP
jgi:hypothetical protein